MANIVAHTVIRDAKAPWDTRRYGMRGPDGRAPQLRVYASSELHYCQEQAAELLGMGRRRVEPPGLSGPALEELQPAIIGELERRGVAMISNASLRDGRTALRACITNFRTRAEDIDAIVEASAAIGSELAAR